MYARLRFRLLCALGAVIVLLWLAEGARRSWVRTHIPTLERVAVVRLRQASLSRLQTVSFMGYELRWVSVAGSGPCLTAQPLEPGITGVRRFVRLPTGVIHELDLDDDRATVGAVVTGT